MPRLDQPVRVTRTATRSDVGRAGAPQGPTESEHVRTLGRAAAEMDSESMVSLLSHRVRADGPLPTWRRVVLPVIAHLHRLDPGAGEAIEVERFLTDSFISALAGYRGFVKRSASCPPVLLAAGPAELQTLSLHLIAAELAPLSCPVLLMGARVPASALTSAARSTQARAILIWQEDTALDRSAEALDLAVLRRIARTAPIVLGGRGWTSTISSDQIRRADSIEDAVQMLTPSQGPGTG